MEDSTTNIDCLSNEVSTPDTSGKVDVAVIGNDEIPTNTDDENTLINQINNSDNTPNVEQTNMEPVTDSPMCSGVVSTPVATRVMQYDKKRYWSMIANKEPLPFQELISKYDFNWCREPFLNNEGEKLAHAYAVYGVIPKEVWYGLYLSKSPLTGETVLNVALRNHTIPPIFFYELFTGERDDDEEVLSIICPEALDMSLKDLILAIRNYKSSFVPAKVPDMDLDNKFVKDE